VKVYESSTATLRALLAHPSLQHEAVERTFDALADANADARELDEAVRFGTEMAVGVADSRDDEEDIKAELAALEAEAIAEAQVGGKTQRPAITTLPGDVSEAARQDRERASTRASERRPEQALAV
jgi:hypothetical protein